MKKVLLLVSAMALVFASVSFGAWKSWEDFNSYKEARKVATEAEAAGNTAVAIANYQKAAELAGKSATKDIQAWQINNAAFVQIKQFKALVGYDEKLAKLTELKPSKEKLALQKEMANVFSANVAIINDAKAILESGKALDGGEAPTAKIQSNIDFIDWVLKFVSENLGETAVKPATEAATVATVEVKK